MRKSRNKPYRPRQLRVPMTAENTAKLELQWYVHLDGFLRTPTADGYNTVVTMVATTERAVHAQGIAEFDPYIRSVKRALCSIVDRCADGTDVNITQQERATLAAGASFIEAAIKRCRYDTFVMARAETAAERRRLGVHLTTA
ncbi:hypothetical protein AB4Z48_17800 [Cupriavidus sp. 2TAF22]|uniref:hypothetical protein n=1 Tax=unclassified Cupriavidus TaxID=2640874 RepID=UPI003F90A11E